MKPRKLKIMKPGTRIRPFSPSMVTAVRLLTEQFQRSITELVQSESKSLGLPVGAIADVEHMQWTILEP